MLFKRKVKLWLIEDYIKLFSINAFLTQVENIISENDLGILKSSCQNLIKSYEKLMFKFGVMDISLLILQKQLKEGEVKLKKEFNLNLKDRIDKFTTDLNTIKENLISKLKSLSFNDTEQRYITIGL